MLESSYQTSGAVYSRKHKLPFVELVVASEVPDLLGNALVDGAYADKHRRSGE